MNISSSSALYSPYYGYALHDSRATRVEGANASDSKPNAQPGVTGKQLTEAEQKQVEELKKRDMEVRQHEMAHLAAAGGLAQSGASYSYQRGPDGVNYAIGGEVHVDTSSGTTPEDTLRRAEQLQRAALAPSDPSGADRAVAAKAQQMAIEARTQIALERGQNRSETDPDYVARAYDNLTPSPESSFQASA